MQEFIIKELKSSYIYLLTILLLSVFFLRLGLFFCSFDYVLSVDLSFFFVLLVFVSSVFFSVAFPIWMRVVFAYSRRKKKVISVNDFLSFQKKILLIVMVSPFLSFLALIFEFPAFFLVGITLCALYGLYYHYPSAEKMKLDLYLFRVNFKIKTS